MGFYTKKLVPVLLAGIIGTSGITGYAQESELIDNTPQVSQNCSEAEREPLDLFFRRMGNQEEITVYWPEESYEDTLGPQILAAIENVNQYIEDNNIGIGRLIPSTDEYSDIRIMNVETYIHHAISNGMIDPVENYLTWVMAYRNIGLTVIEYPNNLTRRHTDEELCDPDHIMILLSNYRPVESTGHELFEEANSLIGDNPEDMRYFALGTSTGDIICVNSDKLDNYRQCNEEDHYLRYTGLIEHEILHALGIRHDVGFAFDETAESGVIGMNLMTIPVQINLRYNSITESGYLTAPEFSDYERDSFREIHGVRE